MKRLPFIFFILLFAACAREGASKVDQLQVYNTILDELVRNRFHYQYLNKEKVDSLWDHYNYNIHDKSDSIEFHTFIDKITLAVESDTAKQKSILLTHELGKSFQSQSKYIVSDSNKYFDDIRNSLFAISNDLKSVCDSLGVAQNHFVAKDFHSKAFKISSKMEIGMISFSKLVFNKSSTEAALYYEFRCDGDCGFGEILILQSKGGKWVIKETLRLWVS